MDPKKAITEGTEAAARDLCRRKRRERGYRREEL